MKNFVPTLQRMFPNCKEIGDLKLGPNKVKYIVNHGIYPYFKELLKKEILESPFIAICFDESLNKATQNSEMDLIIRY